MTLSALSHLTPTIINWRESLDTPAVVIDLDVVERNLISAAKKFAANELDFRPHIKTHKIAFLAKAQLELGAHGITAQKVSEAEIMADAGVTDILISFNILGRTKLERLARLHERLTLTTIADNPVVVTGLAERFRNPGHQLGVLIEIDGYMNRCGVTTVNEAVALAQSVLAQPGLRFDGFMIYPAPDRWKDAVGFLKECRDACLDIGMPCPILSTGGTPDMTAFSNDGVVTEYRAGSYIYNDRSLVERGVVKLDDCALSVLATVVSTPTKDRAVIDAGSKSLSSDLFGLDGHGLIKRHGDASIPLLSEEHGHLKREPGNSLRVGDRIEIIPNHCCVVSNLTDRVHFVRGDYLVSEHKVDARGTTS